MRKCSRIKVSSTDLLFPVFDKENIEYKIDNQDTIDIYSDISAKHIIQLADEAGVDVISINENNESLEGYFMNLVAKKDGIS